MNVETVSAQPIADQRPGTSGLRKKTRVFMEPGYLENFIQSIFDSIGGVRGKTLVVGGDGRYFNREAIQTILKIAAANAAARVIVGRDGLLSTPAVSLLIRLNRTDGGLILSASHNPGGIDADFGVKFNTSNGGPAPESTTGAIFARTQTIDQYRILREPDIDISTMGSGELGAMLVEVVDPVADYCVLMETLFDFGAIRRLFNSGFTMRFDAMHAITGPYATALLIDTLGAPEGTVLNAVPLEDFGGLHPDPNPVRAKSLLDLMMSREAPDFGAASDGDGDRNMIVGRGIYVTPSDSLAVLAANAQFTPGYKDGLAGVARSMPTSGASDRVAAALGVPSFETPTGWKFFGNLLDAGKATLCGEESAGTGSNHVREKDGLWAVLFWLNVLAVRRQSVAEIMADHWAKFGRNYYSRHDYEAVPAGAANDLITRLRAQLVSLPGQRFAGLEITSAKEFCYRDPVDYSFSENQGICVGFEGGGRAVFRLSGTGTEKATLRLYLECYTGPQADHFREPEAALSAVRDAAVAVSCLNLHLGRTEPDIVT